MNLEYGKVLRKAFEKEENEGPEDILSLITDSPSTNSSTDKIFW